MILKVYLKILLIVLFCAVELAIFSCFDAVILAEELFGKVLRRFEICVLVNNNLCGKLFSSLESPTTFDEIFKVTLVLFVYSRF